MSDPVASIDCGTNSTRLLVARGGADGTLQILERLMTITRLGAGVDARGMLAPDAVDRTLETLRQFRQVLERHGVAQVRAIATSAARDAANRDEFLAAAEEVVGAQPELLSGEEEGRLEFLGATAELDPAEGPFLVVDIGGGSTELSVGTTSAEAARSVDVGSVRLTERYLHGDPPRPEELSAAISVTEAHLAEVASELPAVRAASQLVGLAGTVSTVAAVELGMATYDRERVHHLRLTRAAVEDVFRTLATEPRADRIHNPGLEEARADVIVGGCCILVAVMRFFDHGQCLVSESDILDGLARSLLEGVVG
ncbi:MAG: exopolyphosphatase [Acidimicrobiales bacterium]